jgi:WD40 repeat protein
VVASPDGAHVAASTDRGEVLVWDTHDGRIRQRLGRGWRADWVEDLAWSRDARLLAVATTRSDRGTVRVVDAEGRVVSRFSEDPGVWMGALDFQGGRLLLASRRNTRDAPGLQQTRLWDWRTGRLVRQFDAHGVAVADDPTGALVATNRLLEGLADVWDRRTGRHVVTLEGHTGVISDVSFSADGSRVATASNDGTARIWDPRTGDSLTVLRGPVPTSLRTVEFSRDGRRLLTVGDDGVARVWTLDSGELLRIARHRLTRGLTTAECRRFLHQVPCPALVRGPTGGTG